MNSTKHLDDLAQIRNIMERSTKFLSLSAWAAILAGIYALIGAAVAYRIIYYSPIVRYEALKEGPLNPAALPLFLTAAIVFLLALTTGVWLSHKKAQKAGQKLWNRSAIRATINFAIPLAAGGAFVLILYGRGYYDLLAASTLVFYGLALINAGNFTFSDIRKLGIWEVVVGLVAALFPSNGILFWAIGFGVLHLIYGGILYWKYER